MAVTLPHIIGAAGVLLALALFGLIILGRCFVVPPAGFVSDDSQGAE